MKPSYQELEEQKVTDAMDANNQKPGSTKIEKSFTAEPFWFSDGTNTLFSAHL